MRHRLRTRVGCRDQASARVHQRQFDKRYLPDEPNVYKGGRGSKVQDAHEAIRPTEVGLKPDDLKQYLERDLFKLYQLIWRRFSRPK